MGLPAFWRRRVRLLACQWLAKAREHLGEQSSVPISVILDLSDRGSEFRS